MILISHCTRSVRVRRPRGRSLVLAACTGLTVAACGTGGEERVPPDAVPDSPVPAAAPSSGNVSPAATPPDRGVAAPARQADDTAASGAAGVDWTVGDTRVSRDDAGPAVLVDVRTARHDGFDRVVFDFGTDHVPGYTVRYVDSPVRQCGSGHEVPIDGQGWLSVEMVFAHAHTQEGQATIRERSRRPGLPNILQLELTCDFEGHVEWVVGVHSPTPYRVLELTSPGRLVVDIRQPGGS